MAPRVRTWTVQLGAAGGAAVAHVAARRQRLGQRRAGAAAARQRARRAHAAQAVLARAHRGAAAVPAPIVQARLRQLRLLTCG